MFFFVPVTGEASRDVVRTGGSGGNVWGGRAVTEF